MTAAMACGDPLCSCGCGAWLGQCGADSSPTLYAMSALSDPEDDPPAFRHRAMPNEQDERESRNTITMPPPSEPETKVENDAPDPARVAALRPPPVDEWDTAFLRGDDSVFSRAVMMVASAGRRMDEERKERQSNEERAADRHKEQLAHQSEVLQAVLAADRNSSKNYELLRDEIRHLKDSDLKQDLRLKEGDRRFEQIEQKVAELEKRLTDALKPIAVEFEEIRKLIEDFKKDVPTGQAPAAAT